MGARRVGRAKRKRIGQGRGVLALSLVLAACGGALFLRGCPPFGVCLVVDAVTFACLLLCLAGVFALLRQSAPRGPIPDRDMPATGPSQIDP